MEQNGGMMRKRKVLLLAGLTASLILCVAFLTALVAAGYESERIRQVEDFSQFDLNSFPRGWKARGGNGADVYRVKSDGEKYLQAKAEANAVTIAREFNYDLKDYPLLSWQWKAVVLPRGGDERYKHTGDSGASIYVIFPGMLPKNIKYVWSSSLPVGTDTESPFSSRTKIVVLRNHSSSLETWVSEKVNVYEDYKRLYGEEPEPVRAIGIMSDSDNTKSTALAYYKKIAVRKRESLQ
jgi:hypothetical protein